MTSHDPFVIAGATIYDGTGTEPFTGDVHIGHGQILGLYPSGRDWPGTRVLHADALALCPGLIDAHTHADAALLADPANGMKLSQGVTTQVVGNCGFSAAPGADNTSVAYRAYAQPVLGAYPAQRLTFSAYLDALRAAPIRGRVTAMVGAGAVRVALRGFDPAPLTQRELADLCAMVREALHDGAAGLSLGLMYVPECHSTTEELTALAREVARADRVLAVHLRGEGGLLLPSLREMLGIARTTGVKLHISHLKAAGRASWGTMRPALQLLEQAAQQGLDVDFDAYPYEAGATTMASLMPPWLLAQGVQGALSALKQPACAHELRCQWREEQPDWDNMIAATGWDAVIPIEAPSTPDALGISVAQWALRRGMQPDVAAIELFCRNAGNVTIAFFHMDLEEVRTAIRHPMGFVASDTLCGAGVHPRAWGTFARVLGPMVREGLLPLAQAVAKCTAMPAMRFMLPGVGVIRPGMRADLLLFDPATLQDCATYAAPCQPPIGIHAVYVGGELAYDGALHAAPGGLLVPAAGASQL